MPAASLAAKPQSLSHVAAATLPLAALTARHALADHAALQPGEQVLVQGGAGGVGIFAVQLAAILGGHVTATAVAPTPASYGTSARNAYQRRGRAARPGRGRVRTSSSNTVGGAVLDGSYGLLREGGAGHPRRAPGPGAGKLGGGAVQPRFVEVEHSDRVSGIGECACERDAEARSDADDYCGSGATAVPSSMGWEVMPSAGSPAIVWSPYVTHVSRHSHLTPSRHPTRLPNTHGSTARTRSTSATTSDSASATAATNL